jgi:hypothetical protein
MSKYLKKIKIPKTEKFAFNKKKKKIKSHFLNNYFWKFENSFFVDRLDVKRTHINQKIDFFENPTSACQTTVRLS